MDLDALHEKKTTPVKKKKKKKAEKNRGAITGRAFSKRERAFIRDNFETMKDDQIARELGRTKSSIKNYRIRRNLIKPSQGVRPAGPSSSRANFMGNMDDFEKSEHFLKQLRASALYKAFRDACAETKYIRLYEQKFVEFMLDPTVETVTAMERDIWHEMTVAQIRELEYIRKEKVAVTRIDKEGNSFDIFPDYAREIAECTKTIQKCQDSLNVERKQRLKDGNDTAMNFTEVVKELRSSAVRRKVGDEAAMMKYMTEKHYNDHLGKNIASGKFDLGLNFKDGKEPEGLDGDFTQEAAFLEEQNIDADSPLVGKTGEEEKEKAGD